MFRSIFAVLLLAILGASAVQAQSTELQFKGFGGERYAQHDALLRRLTSEFNRNKASWTGASAEQAQQIPNLNPALIKALLVQESGGGKAGDLAAWVKDPGQVNLPGNWSKYKADLGLKEPLKPNTGSLEGNVKATIRFLTRKGFGRSGRAPKERAGATFDGWRVALERYNGRSLLTENGKPYSTNYAERILQRARHPERHAPVSLPKPKPSGTLPH